MDLDGYIRFLLALMFVLGLIGLLTWLVRKLGIGGKVMASGARNRKGKDGARAGPRLGVVEAATLDGRRKLVLIRRDDREHLVILGANGETVVEAGITVPGETEDTAPGTAPSFQSYLEQGDPETDALDAEAKPTAGDLKTRRARRAATRSAPKKPPVRKTRTKTNKKAPVKA